jgi:hypothetical protein
MSCVTSCFEHQIAAAKGAKTTTVVLATASQERPTRGLQLVGSGAAMGEGVGLGVAAGVGVLSTAGFLVGLASPGLTVGASVLGSTQTSNTAIV